MNILGVHIGHDSGAAFICGGELRADVAEERFARIKHYAGVPTQAMAYCRDAAGLSMKDIEGVAVATLRPVLVLNHLLELPASRRESGWLGTQPETTTSADRSPG